MKLFAVLESNGTLYEWAQRLISLNFRLFLRVLREEGFFKPGLSVLDVGCGTGFLRDHLQDADYLGIDLNPAYITTARRRRGDCFQLGDALDVGKIPRQFDRIVCIGLFHHLDEAQARSVLAGCRSRLAVGGEMFVIDALWPPGKNAIGKALRQSDNGSFVRTFEEWERLFTSELDVRVLRAIAQWPYDYIFVRSGAGALEGK